MIRFTECCFCRIISSPVLIENASQRSEFENRYNVLRLGNDSCWRSSRQKGIDDITSCITFITLLGVCGARCFNGLQNSG